MPAATWREYGLEHLGGPDCRGQADIIPHEIEAERLIEIAEKIAERIAPYAEVGRRKQDG